MADDIMFYGTLFVCISLGGYYKKLEKPDMKRTYGTGLGILITCLICGYNIFHTMFMVWGNVIIIKCCEKRYIHQMSLAYTWIYLLYLHVNLSCTVYVIWLIQTMALRLVGLAFEIYGQELKVPPTKTTEVDSPIVEPTAADIIAYTYFFVGLHKGPYYRWKIFNDHFNLPFAALGDCRIITAQKLKKAIILALGYCVMDLIFSSSMYEEDYFYNEHGSDFRFLYNVPQLVKYLLYAEMLMLLATSVFTEAGFGLYPAKCEAVPGYGPTAALSLLKMAETKPSVAMEQEYNFSMLKCFDNSKVLLGPKMNHTLRGWDMSTRYWFWSNIYNKLLRANKEVRSASSFLAWSVWYGPTVQQLILSSTLWIYIHLEEEYATIYDTTGPMKTPWHLGFTIMRVFCLIYLTPCFVVDDTSTVLRYYHSIFWLFHFLLAVLIVGAIVASTADKREHTGVVLRL